MSRCLSKVVCETSLCNENNQRLGMFRKRGAKNLRRKNSDSPSEADEEVYSQPPPKEPPKVISVSSLLSFVHDDEDGQIILPKRKDKSSKFQSSSSDRSRPVTFKNRDKRSPEFNSTVDDPIDIDLLPESESVKSSLNTRQWSASVQDGIPDSNLIHQIRKKREMARMQQSTPEFIPIKETGGKYTGERSRLVREDENDLSDVDEETPKFLASKVSSTEMDRRLAEANFLSVEQGESDVEDQQDFDNWEKEQLRKAVSSHQLSWYQQEQKQTASFHQQHQKLDSSDDVVILEENFNGDRLTLPSSMANSKFEGSQTGSIDSHVMTGGTSVDLISDASALKMITLDDIRGSLQQRLEERKSVLQSLNSDCDRAQDQLVANQATITKLELEAPEAFQKYQFLQEMQAYMRDLIDCLDDKVPIISEIDNRWLKLLESHKTILWERRLKDVDDQYNECQNIINGRKFDVGEDYDERCARVADREARRTRRRLLREKPLAVVSIVHQDGLSSDDEESPSQTLWMAAETEKIFNSVEEVFVDASAEFTTVSSICEKLSRWQHQHSDSFSKAYIGLYMPKLLGPMVRMQMIMKWADIKNLSADFHSENWLKSIVGFGQFDGDTLVTSGTVCDGIVDIVPQIVEQVICLVIKDIIENSWDPVSKSQTERLTATIRALISDYPTMTGSSKNVQTLIDKVVAVTKKCLGEVFVPLFPKSALDKRSTGAAAFQDRQFWFCVKLMKNVLLWERILSTSCLLQLAIDGVLNRYLILGLQCENFTDSGALVKARAIVNLIKPQWFEEKTREMTQKQLEPLSKILCRIVEEIDKDTAKKCEVLELRRMLCLIGAKNPAAKLV